MKRAVIVLAVGLAGCGAAKPLQAPPNTALPVAPYGTKATPTPQQLLTPTTQQRPQRSDELLTGSDERRSDEFDLPPN